MADGSTFPAFTGSRYVVDAARLSALESDIRRVLRTTLHNDPELANTQAAARAIINNSGDAKGLSRAILYDGSELSHIAVDSIIHAYVNGLDLVDDEDGLRVWFERRGRDALQSADRYDEMAVGHDRMADPAVWRFRSEVEREEYRGRAATCRRLAFEGRVEAQRFADAAEDLGRRVAA